MAVPGGPVSASASDVRKLVTVVFTDLEGSTALGERHDAEAIRGVMTRYFAAMRAVVESHGGTVEKFIGDAVMAAFGIPQVREDDALRAVRAAIEMHAERERLNEEFERQWGVRIAVRTGVNTGEVIAGDPTVDDSFASGDMVNVAARLEQAAPADEILIGEATYALVRDAVEVEAVEPLSLKGKAEPMPAYRLLSVRERAASPARRLDVPLVGREEEVQQLLARLERAEAEATIEVALVLGEAGVGKSRLAAEFLKRVEAGRTALAGRCLPYGEGITFWPIAEMVKSAAGLDDDESAGEALAKISALFEEGDRSSAEGVGAALGLVDAEFAIEEVFVAIRRLFEGLARREPLVLALDDLHWAEQTLLDLVDHLAATSEGAPILFLALTRPELLERRGDWSERFTCVGLAPMSVEESGEIAAGVLGGEVEPGLLARLTDAAKGNPLYVEEMIRMLVDEGTLMRRNGDWAVVGELTEIATPPTIEALLSARLEQLPAPERAVLEAASVVGEVFWPGAVGQLAVADAVEVRLPALLAKQLVVPHPTSFAGEPGYRFAHILLRDAAYGRLLKQTRATYHEGFADWVERAAGDRLGAYEEIVGYHLEQAHRYLTELGPEDDRARGLADRAAERLAAAGARAHERGDTAAAAGLLTRAVVLFGDSDPRTRRSMLGLGVALAESGQGSRADEVLDRTATAARNAGERALEVRARVERELITAVTAESSSIADEAIPVLEAACDDGGLARALQLRALVLLYTKRSAEAVADLTRALEHARRAGARRDETMILAWLVLGLVYGPEPAAQALRDAEELLRASRPDAAVVVAVNLAVLHAMCGDFGRARSDYERAQTEVEQFGHAFVTTGSTQFIGTVELLAGDPVAAERVLRRGYEEMLAIGHESLAATSAHLLADALEAQGRYPEAERFVGESRRFADPDDLDVQINWRRMSARLQARRGDLDEARRLAEEAIARSLQTDDLNAQADALLALGEVQSAAGETDAAEATVRRAKQLYEEKGNVVSAERAAKRLAEISVVPPTPGG